MVREVASLLKNHNNNKRITIITTATAIDFFATVQTDGGCPISFAVPVNLAQR